MHLRIFFLFNFLLISFLCLGQTIFSNVSDQMGIGFEHNTEGEFEFDTGAAWFDADGDGDMDLYISQRIGANHFYRNDLIETGQLSFTNIASEVEQDAGHIGAGVSVADYDNDGDLDIYLANHDEDVLLQNDGKGRFIDVTDIAFPEFPAFLLGRGTSATWGDLNGDGWLDLYVSHHYDYKGSNTLDHFFLNNGGEPVTFTNMTSIFTRDEDGDDVFDNDAWSFISVMTDYDSDGDLDLYVSNDCPYGPDDNKLWRNDGNLEFHEVSSDVGPFIGGSITGGSEEPIHDCQNVMGIDIGDPNRDGQFDMFYTNWNFEDEAAVFLLNDGGQYFNKTIDAGLADYLVPETGLTRLTWGTVFIDYNLDMLEDLAVSAGILTTAHNQTWRNFQPNLLYKNSGIEDNIPQFNKINDELSGFADPAKGRTLVKADYDNDGDPDLFLVNYDSTAILYQNNNDNGHNWLIIDLKGAGPPLSNSYGIGAKIKLTAEDGIVQHHEVRSGSSLGGGNDIGAYFGLGRNENVTAEVEWPSGIKTVHEKIEINSRVSLEETQPEVLFLEEDKVNGLRVFPNPVFENAKIEFWIDKGNMPKILLLDISGRIVKQIIEQKRVQEGYNSLEVSMEGLKEGLYILSVELENETLSTRILKN